MTKIRKHTNNKGRRMVKSGTYLAPLQKVAKQLGVRLIIGKPQKKTGI